jgi:hypothetical protein
MGWRSHGYKFRPVQFVWEAKVEGSVIQGQNGSLVINSAVVRGIEKPQSQSHRTSRVKRKDRVRRGVVMTA